MSKKTVTSPKYKSPSARTENQRLYIKSIISNDLTICEGPAGSGKTCLAIGMGITSLRNNKFEKIFIARPVVEAGEQIGFLPGDIDHKMDPFVRPIFDELEGYASYTEIALMRNNKQIEIVPIGYMRGRTLKNAFIICDECQNLSFDQMKMLVTRMGQGSKMVLTGDSNQSDLPKHKTGAFKFLCDLMHGEEGVGIVKFNEGDIQRHSLVGKLIKKWELHVDNYKKDGKLIENLDTML